MPFSNPPPDPLPLGATKTVSRCGSEVLVTLSECRKCHEPTYFDPGVHVCSDCAEEFISTGPERSSLRMSDYVYQGNIADRVEAMGLPDGGRRA